jgi:hypothetical protein
MTQAPLVSLACERHNFNFDPNDPNWIVFSSSNAEEIAEKLKLFFAGKKIKKFFLFPNEKIGRIREVYKSGIISNDLSMLIHSAKTGEDVDWHCELTMVFCQTAIYGSHYFQFEIDQNKALLFLNDTVYVVILGTEEEKWYVAYRIVDN